MFKFLSRHSTTILTGVILKKTILTFWHRCDFEIGSRSLNI